MRVGADVVGMARRQAADLPDLKLLKHVCGRELVFWTLNACMGVQLYEYFL